MRKTNYVFFCSHQEDEKLLRTTQVVIKKKGSTLCCLFQKVHPVPYIKIDNALLRKNLLPKNQPYSAYVDREYQHAERTVATIWH